MSRSDASESLVSGERGAACATASGNTVTVSAPTSGASFNGYIVNVGTTITGTSAATTFTITVTGVSTATASSSSWSAQ